ncbi:MAG: cytochrome P450, partial [Solirubrobacterales bacterium]|nr:cytochrome P450 [Solirubrobacterales bacterium]
MALPPGPTLPPALQTARFIARPVPLMERTRREFGGTFTLSLLPIGKAVFISDPPSIKALFSADRVNTIAAGRNVVLKPLLGERSLLLLEGDDHLARRKLMLPPFHGERMRAYEQAMEEVTELEVERWPVGEPFPLHPAMQSITLDVIMSAVFGVAEGRRQKLRQALLDILAATRSPMMAGITFPVVRELPRFRALRRQVEATDELLGAEIAEHRSSPGLEQNEDILSLLISARDENGEGMDDRELRDQLMTLLMAGHETTATALAWTFDLLFRRADAMGRLREEVAAGDGTKYLDAVIEEALRLRPVVPFTGRELRRPAELGGNELPEGTTVFAAIYLAHTDPEVFPDPYAFLPERFLDAKPDTFAWIPFGGGTRRCIGAAFAQLEMRVVLRTILRSAELEPATTAPQAIVRRNVTLSPREGTPAVL